MNSRALTTLAFLTLSLGSTGGAPGQTSSGTPKLPRTSWGDPSIEGTYTNKDEFGTPFERPPELEGTQRREFGFIEEQRQLAVAFEHKDCLIIQNILAD